MCDTSFRSHFVIIVQLLTSLEELILIWLTSPPLADGYTDKPGDASGEDDWIRDQEAYTEFEEFCGLFSDYSSAC